MNLFLFKDNLYDSKNSKGSIYYALRYRRTKDRRSNELISKMNDLSVTNEKFSEDEKQELQIFFKTCLVHKNRAQLIEKLKETVEFRCSLLKSNKENLRGTFPFYFTCPSLVNKNLSARICCFECMHNLLKIQ